MKNLVRFTLASTLVVLATACSGGTETVVVTETVRVSEQEVEEETSVDEDLAQIIMEIAWEDYPTADKREFCDNWNSGPDHKSLMLDVMVAETQFNDPPPTESQIRTFFDEEC